VTCGATAAVGDIGSLLCLLHACVFYHFYLPNIKQYLTCPIMSSHPSIISNRPSHKYYAPSLTTQRHPNAKEATLPPSKIVKSLGRA
jgi:hypothetical protein